MMGRLDYSFAIRVVGGGHEVLTEGGVVRRGTGHARGGLRFDLFVAACHCACNRLKSSTPPPSRKIVGEWRLSFTSSVWCAGLLGGVDDANYLPIAKVGLEPVSSGQNEWEN
jgi:hypothetical protein